MKPVFDPKASYQPRNFDFKNSEAVDSILSKYPDGFQKSAIMPLLDLAQREVLDSNSNKKVKVAGGWIPRAAMDKIADIVGVAPIKVYEVATFYTMYKLAPVGRYVVQFCGTTPCWLCGSAKIMEAAEKHLGVKVGETTQDGYFTLEEVECLGACVNAPMVQINDDYYEDLTPEAMIDILRSLRRDEKPQIGSQSGRRGSMAALGPTSLEDQAKKAGVIS